MVNHCGVAECNGNYNPANKCRIFKLPKDEREQQKWINVLPPRADFVLDPDKFWICERHWPVDTPMRKVPGGHTRPVLPPSIFLNVPASCHPSHKADPRPEKVEDRQLEYFNKKDTISNTFSEFSPDKELKKRYTNVLIFRSDEKFVCVFMTEDYSESIASIVVHNKSTLCSPLTLYAYKGGIRVTCKILNPNNGLSKYSQFFEAVNSTLNFDHAMESVVTKVLSTLENVVSDYESLDHELDELNEIDPSKVKKLQKGKKLKFLTRQLQLFCKKEYTMSDYCFAIETFPRCTYEQLREYIILPSKSKIQSIVSSTDVKNVLTKVFKKVDNDQQKNCFLIVDEVKIRPTVAYSGGVLSGMAKNSPDSKATSILGIMLKCLHGGPSVMISIIPVHKSTASYQFDVVKENAATVEKAGGVVIGSITDNHKVNQHFCKLFERKSDWEAVHPLDDQRSWFLLFDTVHLLKCIRNNWITEKCLSLSLDGETVGSFSDVRALYASERDHILKTTPLTQSSVYPSLLQLQNVRHVLNVFNDKVVAALNLRGACDTARFIQQVLDWWNVVNVSAKGQDTRMRDPNRSAQDEGSNSLQPHLNLFKGATSGHGANRIQSLTHDTKKALIQTTEGQMAVCRHLFTEGFQYVLLRELQSDRIEGEFSVYRQSTGGNAFMRAADVICAFKRRLTRFAATFLESIDTEPVESSCGSHVCNGMEYDDAATIEACVSAVKLTDMEEYSTAYVAGWLEMKCDDLCFSVDEPLVSGEVIGFIQEVSRGYLTIPHVCTVQLVNTGLRFMKMSRNRACCRTKVVGILHAINSYHDYGLSSTHLLRRLANVLLHGLQKLEQDHQTNAKLYQTSIKKARLAE